MNDDDRAETDSLIRVNVFADDNAADFPAHSKVAGYFTTIKTGLTQLEQAGAIVAGAVSAKKSGTSRKSAARSSLLEAMRHVSKFARIIEDEDAAFENKFNLRRKNLNDGALLSMARSFAENALPVKAKFVEYGLDANFIDELIGALDEFDSAHHTQNSAGIKSVGANADTGDIIDRMLEAKAKAHPIVQYMYRDNPQKLAEWDTARRVARPQKKVKDVVKS